MVLVTWKTWKLKRVAIGTNDAEVQPLVETEDVLFRTRMLWAAIDSAGTVNPGKRTGFLHASEEEAKLVLGLLGSDPKGGYDSIMVNESPMLGLSNTRSAIQAFQLKEAIPLCLTRLLWLASDWNLSERMTKKKEERRKSLEFFLRCRVWMLKFDPNFIYTQSARKERATKGPQSSSCKDYRPRTHNNFRVMQFIQSCPIYVQHDEFWPVIVLWPKSFRGPSFQSQLVRYAIKTGLVWLCLWGGFQYAHLIELCWTSHSLEHPSIDLQSQSQFLSCYLNLPNQNSPSKCWPNQPSVWIIPAVMQLSWSTCNSKEKPSFEVHIFTLK